MANQEVKARCPLPQLIGTFGLGGDQNHRALRIVSQSRRQNPGNADFFFAEPSGQAGAWRAGSAPGRDGGQATRPYPVQPADGRLRSGVVAGESCSPVRQGVRKRGGRSGVQRIEPGVRGQARIAGPAWSGARLDGLGGAAQANAAVVAGTIPVPPLRHVGHRPARPRMRQFPSRTAVHGGGAFLAGAADTAKLRRWIPETRTDRAGVIANLLRQFRPVTSL